MKDNSIHHSFQRGTTVHATYFVEVAHNVAYDVRGHTFFVEDGNEKYNTFDGNLAVSTRCSAVRVTQLALGNYCIDFLAAFASWRGITAFVSWSGIAAFLPWCFTVNNSHFFRFDDGRGRWSGTRTRARFGAPRP